MPKTQRYTGGFADAGFLRLKWEWPEAFNLLWAADSKGCTLLEFQRLSYDRLLPRRRPELVAICRWCRHRFALRGVLDSPLDVERLPSGWLSMATRKTKLCTLSLHDYVWCGVLLTDSMSTVGTEHCAGQWWTWRLSSQSARCDIRRRIASHVGMRKHGMARKATLRDDQVCFTNHKLELADTPTTERSRQCRVRK